jgi:hypothetical protein
MHVHPVHPPWVRPCTLPIEQRKHNVIYSFLMKFSAKPNQFSLCNAYVLVFFVCLAFLPVLRIRDIVPTPDPLFSSVTFLLITF